MAKQTKNNQNTKPIADGRGTAARWAFACLGAVCAGVGFAYYWRVFYYLDTRAAQNAAWAPARVTLLCVLAALLCVGAAALLRYACKTFVQRSALCIALCGLLFVFANPPMQTPDESQYYLRCDSISRGNFNFDGNRGYPADVAALYNAFPGAWVNAHTSQGMARDEDTGEKESYTTAGYALKQYGEDGYPQSVADSFAAYRAQKTTADATVKEPVNFLVVPFLPQALGMALARLLGFDALGRFYAGRIANLLVYTALCTLALAMAKKYRPALLCMMLLPLSLFMAGSLSYDASLLGCYYLMAALLTRPVWDTKTMAVYAAACVFVNVAKPYINLLWVLPLLCLPQKSWKGKGKRYVWLAGMLAGALLVTQIVEWYGVALRTGYPAVIARMGGEDVDQLAQLQFVLKNPLRYLAVLLGTLYENDFFLGQTGLFGWKDLPISMLNFTGPAVLLAGGLLSASAEKPSQIHPLAQTRGRLVAGCFCLLYAVGAMTAMYITYTPVSMVRIVGLQARYFLPVWAVALLLLGGTLAQHLRPSFTQAQGENSALCLFAPYAALAALLMYQCYWVGPIFTIG